MSLEPGELESLVMGAVRDTPLLVVIFDHSGNVAWVNPAVELALDVGLDEVQGHPAASVLQGPLPPLTGVTGRVEGSFQLLRSDGSDFWVHGRLSRVRDSAGRRLGTALVSSATASGSHWHHRLLRSTLPAAMGMMGAEVAHEINNPSTWLRLNIDQLWTDLGEHGSLEPELTRELLEECREGLERISVIAGQLRDLAAPDPSDVEETDLREVVAAACSLAPLSPSGQVIVRRELAEVPRIALSPGRFGQAVWSLLALCVREAQTGTDAPVVAVRLHDDGRHVFLDIDVGAPLGLDPAVCQPGARSQGPPELRMARTVLAAHGGLVMPVPEGTGLRVQVPLVKPHNPLI